MKRENDFSQGSVARNIIELALPMTIAQLINVLYNVVDRIYRKDSWRWKSGLNRIRAYFPDYYHYYSIC